MYACAVGEATVTAEVRRAGASSAEASISRTISVEALPEEVIEASGQRRRVDAQTRSGTAAQVGTPGIVPSISFYDVEAREFKVRWGKPSSGGERLTGFGLLIWIEPHEPPYSSAHVVGAAARSHHFTGMDPATKYSFRIHACNGPDSCGYWTNPARTVTTRAEATPPPTATPTPTPRPTPAPTPRPPRPVPTPGPPTVSAALDGLPALVNALEAGAAGWVLGHVVATVTEGSPVVAGYQYRLVVPASTGLQVNDANSRECQWRLTSPTTTVKLESAWRSPGEGIRVLRCGLGAGTAASIEVQRRKDGNGAPVTVQTLTVTVPQAVHHADEQVAYYICGTTASGITAVAKGDCAGFFPAEGIPENHAISADTVDEATYTTAAGAWTGAKVGAGVSRVTSKSAADVVIRGSWAEDKNGGKCKTSVACLDPSRQNSHFNGETTIWIEEPLWLPEPKTGAGIRWIWTSDLALASQPQPVMGQYFEYLPAVMMHEFGHALGLDDTGIPNIMMGPAALQLGSLMPTDTSAAKAIYQHHASHRD